MREIAPDVLQLPLTPRDGINAYLIGDVLVDAGLKASAKKVLRALDGHTVTAHALTHAHVDHVGSSQAVMRSLGIDGLACGALDAEAARTGHPVPAPGVATKVLDRFARTPPAPVARELHEGDELAAGFVVLDVPGHSPGHVAFWRESDRVLIAGDVWNTMNLLTTVPGLHEPPRMFSPDPAANRDGARRLAELRPAVLGVGHGPVLRDPDALAAFTATLER